MSGGVRAVVFSRHAEERLRSRSVGVSTAAASLEIARAFEEGRYASRKPRWIVSWGPRGKHPPGGGKVRYAWPDDRSRVYACRAGRSRGGYPIWLVTSVLIPPASRAELPAAVSA